ncbi:MAG: hypothetical protein V3S14_14235 [Anaerolineae bacterium]
MRSHVLVPLIALVVVQIFCCCSIPEGPQPPYSIMPSDEDAQNLQERWDTVLEENLDGTFTITITEEEMTSLATQMLAKQQDLPPISNLQVHLRDGRIEAYATVTVNDSLSLPGMVAFSVTATDGKVNVTLQEAAFGPMPIPDSALETVTDTLNNLIAESVLSEMDEAIVTDIQINAGEMTLTGTITPNQP